MNIKAALVIIIYSLWTKKVQLLYTHRESSFWAWEKCKALPGRLFCYDWDVVHKHNFGVRLDASIWMMATNNIQLTNEVYTAVFCFEIIKSTDKSEFAFLRRNTPGVLNDENSTLPKRGTLCNLTYSCIS